MQERSLARGDRGEVPELPAELGVAGAGGFDGGEETTGGTACLRGAGGRSGAAQRPRIQTTDIRMEAATGNRSRTPRVLGIKGQRYEIKE